MQTQKFELIIDGLPYLVNVVPFLFNEETRYLVSYNGGKENIFAWDSDIGRLRAIDDEASTIPANLEKFIAEKIQSLS